jgi:hypothetical protein
VYSQKGPKIELSQEYPCPCRRRARLIPITLTEAFGCDRCQQIFVVDESGHFLEQLASLYPYKRTWRWTGQNWILSYPGGDSYLLAIASVLGLLLLLWVVVIRTLPAGVNVIFWIVGGLFLLFIMPALRSWLTYRR